jgi:hypothetical protein
MPEPRIIPRKAWDAGPNRTAVIDVKKDVLFVHHTVANAPGLFSKIVGAVRRAAWKSGLRAAERAEMRNLQAIARSRGFIDISYSFVVFPSGRVYAGRGRHREGAHTLSWNDRYAVAAAGNYEVNQPTDAMVRSIRLLQEKLNIRSRKGHRDVSSTSCPGRLLYSRI